MHHLGNRRLHPIRDLLSVAAVLVLAVALRKRKQALVVVRSYEIRTLARHKTRDADLHYMAPDVRYVENAQNKRLVIQNENRAKLEMLNAKC